MDTPKLSKLILDGYANLNSGKRIWPTYDGKELDRQQYITSSEIGNCARMIKFGKQGNSAPFEKWGFAERGNVIEAWAVEMIQAALPNGWELALAGKKQVSFHHGSQSGTPDGLLIDYAGERWWAVEFKSVDPRTNYLNLPRKPNIKQLQQNMALMEHSLGGVCKGGLLIYIDASDYQKNKEVFVKRDPLMMQELTDRADLIREAKSPEDLPAEGMFKDKGCQYCDYTSQCSAMVTLRLDEAKAIEQHERAMKDVFK